MWLPDSVVFLWICGEHFLIVAQSLLLLCWTSVSKKLKIFQVKAIVTSTQRMSTASAEHIVMLYLVVKEAEGRFPG